MDEVIVKWSGPYKLIEPTPREEGGVNGLYIIVYGHDDVVYIGKANAKKGAMARAKFGREKYIRRRRMRGIFYDESKAEVYTGHVTPTDLGLIDLAEQLLISHLYRTRSHQMVNSSQLYYERKPPLRIINEAEMGKLPGKMPPFLSKEIESPSKHSD